MVCLEAGRSFNLLFRPSGVSPMIFDDRIQAAELLAQRLEPYRGQNPLVLAIPRGAVPMGRVIADALEGDLDVVLVHKLSAPLQPELAIGSVSEAGDVYLGDLVEQLGVGQEYIDAEVKRELEMLRRRRARYTPVRKSMSARDPNGGNSAKPWAAEKRSLGARCLCVLHFSRARTRSGVAILTVDDSSSFHARIRCPRGRIESRASPRARSSAL